MPETERVYTPSRSYDIQCKIKDLDYSNDLYSVQVVSSLSTAYQVIMLQFFLDPADIILQDLFGDAPIYLRIRLLDQDEIPKDQVDFELMYVTSDHDIPTANTLTTEQQKDRTSFNIQTVCRKPFKSMQTIVNGVFGGKTIREVIEQISRNVGVTVNFDTDGENIDIIDQVCIPPTTFYKIIKEYDPYSSDPYDGYLDQRFGLHHGSSSVFCQFDNKVYIKNLTKKMVKSQAFTVYQITESLNNEEVIKQSLDGRTFYTYDDITNDYTGNAKFSAIAPTLRHIVKPRDTLSYIVEQDLDEVCSTYGLIYKNNKVPTDLNISKESRIQYYQDDTGFDYSSNQFNARFGRAISDLATLSINLERNLEILNLMDVGEVVKFITHIQEYVDISGKYVLWSSNLTFHREGEWQATAQINLVRTNKTM